MHPVQTCVRVVITKWICNLVAVVCFMNGFKRLDQRSGIKYLSLIYTVMRRLWPLAYRKAGANSVFHKAKKMLQFLYIYRGCVHFL